MTNAAELKCLNQILQRHHNAGITWFWFFLFSGRSFSILVEHALEDSSEKYENKMSRDHSSSTDPSDHIMLSVPRWVFQIQSKTYSLTREGPFNTQYPALYKKLKRLSELSLSKSNFQFFETHFFYLTKEISRHLTEETSLQSKRPRILAI